MRHKELAKFTVGELSNFTHGELTLEVPELLQRIKDDNRPVPYSVIEKLQKLCEELQKEPELKGKLPPKITEPNKQMTFKEVAERVTFVIMLLKSGPELFEKYAPIVRKVIDAIQALK